MLWSEVGYVGYRGIKVGSSHSDEELVCSCSKLIGQNFCIYTDNPS